MCTDSEPVIETPRLQLYHVTLEDAQFFITHMNHPEWVRHIGDRGLHTLEDARTYIQERYITSYKENGFGSYKVLLRDSGETIGLCGLFNRSELPKIDLGFSILPDFQRQGYAYEAASAVMRFAQTQLGLSSIIAITAPDNLRSQGLLEKLGFSRNGKVMFQKDDLLQYSFNTTA